MTELDAIWVKMVGEATDLAEKSSREAVAEYLRLRASNDAIRSGGVAWLLNTAIGIAADAAKDLPRVEIHREEPHTFPNGHANMVGSRLTIALGVRCLSLEAGWARTPADGVMRRGALAHARISHFGYPKRTAEFDLIRGSELPVWKAVDGSEITCELLEQEVGFVING